MKVAIVHDDLMRRGGAEQVVLSMLKAYPNADLYTLCYRAHLTYPEFKDYKIKTSIFNFLARNEKWMKWLFFPFGLLSMKLLSVKGYDVIIISTTYCGKYVSTDRAARVFMYTHTPFRLAWDSKSYKQYNESRGLKRKVFDVVISILKRVDKKEAQKGDHFLGNTNETAERIKHAYGISDIKIIYPPVKCSNFHVSKNTSDYFLIVTRLEYYKKVDLAIHAFNKLGYKLIIVGNGHKKEELKALAKENIEFRSGLPKEEIAELYAGCRAFILPQHEDYGITPLEANASGRPVIAYGNGGVLETMTPYNGTSKKFTAVFFKEQTTESLIDAVKLFETLEVDPAYIRQHAEKFDEPFFVQELTRYVDKKLQAGK
jgi:glycosyltransferase involved in cell wall biosynthesis